MRIFRVEFYEIYYDVFIVADSLSQVDANLIDGQREKIKTIHRVDTDRNVVIVASGAKS